MVTNKRELSIILVSVILLGLTACRLPAELTPEPPSVPTIYAELLRTLTPQPLLSGLETPPISPSRTPTIPTQPEPISSQDTIWLHPGLPKAFLAQLTLPESMTVTEEEAVAQARIVVDPLMEDTGSNAVVQWVYVLVAPFYTLREGISLDRLKSTWQGAYQEPDISQIFVTEETMEAMRSLLGNPDDAVVRILPGEEFRDMAISEKGILAILPFEDLEPSWKILRVDQQAPIDGNFAPDRYPLTMSFQLSGELSPNTLKLPPGNYSPTKRSVVVMTGVTALVRATAYQMEMRGVLFPGQDIQPWLSTADVTHISNEVPFAEDCPPPDPYQQDLIFCSDPDYIALLAHVGTDVVELSGNHLQDWGDAAAHFSLDLYDAKGWAYYAGGRDISDARTPALIEHNGHHFAFLGCNPAGPSGAWATPTQPGTAPCGDYAWLLDLVRNLRAEGYLPIVTFQYIEDYTAYPSTQMVTDFRRVAEAGAVVVNGSQAHTPKTMEFYQGAFIHYGLGNLFFDQMEVYYNDVYLAGTRDEFIDRLVFYDGRLVSVELLTAKLEDYARPRPMSPEERWDFLKRIFDAALSE